MARLTLDRTRIEAAMAARFWTQAKLAEASGLSTAAVSDILKRGHSSPTSAGKLAGALGLTSGDILKRRRAS